MSSLSGYEFKELAQHAIIWVCVTLILLAVVALFYHSNKNYNEMHYKKCQSIVLNGTPDMFLASNCTGRN